MGYLVHGKCYGAVADALDALKSEYPHGSATTNDYLVLTSGSITVGGVASLGVSLNGGATQTRTVTLASCTNSAGVGSTDGLLMVAAFFAVWALGVIGGLKR